MENKSIKEQTYSTWCSLHRLKEAVIQPENYLREIATYGDLEKESTWEAAYTALTAKFLADGCPEDGQFFIEFYLLIASKKWGWRHLLERVVRQLETYPEAVEEIATGLRTIAKYGCQYGATLEDIQEFKEILINGNQETWTRLLRPEPVGLAA